MALRRAAQGFGQLAVEAGLLTEAQLQECLKAGEEAEKAGRAPLDVEKLAVERGFMTLDQVRLLKRAEDRLRRDEVRSQPVRIGNCEVMGKLGEGGLGVVYKARQISMGRVVALKVLHKKWMKDEEFKKRFLLEARLAGRLSHQNLIQVYDVGMADGSYFFLMEYVDGETVEDMVERDGPLPVDRALEIVTQVLRAITYISRYNIVHRDIKPGNIMLTRAGVAKLADFGFVKSKFERLLSTEGEVLGTPDYISPEQAMGETEIDLRSDIYSLGASLYHMVTGHPPFRGSSSEVMQKHIKEEPRDPRAIRTDAPESVVNLIRKMMAKDPAERYQTTQELFEDIELVRMGHDPAGGAHEAGKATILRAFNIGKARLNRYEAEIRDLKARVRDLRIAFWISVAAAGLLLGGLVAAIAVLAGA